MALVLNEDWTAYAVGQMHKYRISNTELAEACGYAPPYLSTVMNGNKEFKSDEAAQRTKDRVLAVLERVISEKMSEVENNAEQAEG